MKKIVALLFLLSCTYTTVWGQLTGGNNTYDFLELSSSARVSALGGYQIALVNNDVSLVLQNPALTNKAMHKHLAVNSAFYVADINFGYAGYAHHFDSIATTFAAGVQYINYGNFVQTDETAAILGQFSAGEYAVHVSAARQYKKIRYGASLKFISSTLAGFNSVGLAADLGATYHSEEKRMTASLVLKNIGSQLTTYIDTREPLPFDIQLALSKRLKYLPFRFTVTAHHLHTWDIRYNDPALQTDDTFFGEEDNSSESFFFDTFFRHIAFNGELYLGKALDIRAGYNHLRRQELSVANVGGMAGFSFGAGLHIKRINIDYGYAIYHLAGGVHHIGLGINFNKAIN